MYITAPSSPPMLRGSVARTLTIIQNWVLPQPGGLVICKKKDQQQNIHFTIILLLSKSQCSSNSCSSSYQRRRQPQKDRTQPTKINSWILQLLLDLYPADKFIPWRIKKLFRQSIMRILYFFDIITTFQIWGPHLSPSPHKIFPRDT